MGMGVDKTRDYAVTPAIDFLVRRQVPYGLQYFRFGADLEDSSVLGQDRTSRDLPDHSLVISGQGAPWIDRSEAAGVDEKLDRHRVSSLPIVSRSFSSRTCMGSKSATWR